MSFGAAQQGAQDAPRTQLEVVAWVGLRVGGGAVSGNPLSSVTSVIQFDQVSGIMALSPHIRTLEGGRAQKGNNGYCQHFCQGESLTSCPHSDNSVSPCKSLEHAPLFPVQSRPSVGAQSKQVRHREILLTDRAPFVGLCSCRLLLAAAASAPLSCLNRAASCLCRLLHAVVAGRLVLFLVAVPSVHWIPGNFPCCLFHVAVTALICL